MSRAMRREHGRARPARPGRGPAPGLVRVRLPSGREGWRATARLPSGPVRKVFLDEQYGTASGARKAARAWRTAQLRAAGVPDADSRRVVLKARTGSGVVGVHLRPARRGASASWTATYEKADGTRLQRSWSVKQHGNAQALALAVQQREAWEIADLGSALPKTSGVSALDHAKGSMEAPDSGAPDARRTSDDELLAQWLREGDEGGPSSIAVFIRYRELVRTELEGAGLSPLEAVKRVATVFHLAQANHPERSPETPLRERLLLVAREVGRDPNWSPRQ